jgi:twitching motility protein PilT
LTCQGVPHGVIVPRWYTALLDVVDRSTPIDTLPCGAAITMPDESAVAIHNWLGEAVAAGASDLHIVTGYRPTLRLHGRLVELAVPVLTDEVVRAALIPLCPPRVLAGFETQSNADFALELTIDGQSRRFRVNYFVSGQSIGACFRVIAAGIPDFAWAGIPAALADRLAHFRNGLVLICGVTGAGKTTTLAMIINLLNQEGGYRIITVEDPVEYVFPTNPNSIVTQREVGHDVASFADGLKYGLRQDPDVILVGEIRDRATAQIALSAAETGHLVFSTLHTRDVKGAISRYVDLFPQGVQNEIRSQLSFGLRAVISQHLLPSRQEGAKRELAMEIMFNNAPIASGIRFGKIESIDTNIQTGRSDGMITLDESIKRLLQAGKISREVATRFVSDQRYLAR